MYLRLAALCVVMLPVTFFHAWVTWSGLEAHFMIRTRSPINAKIETISMYKNTYYGDISFILPRNGGEKHCRVNEQLGGESLQLRVGQTIQVVPRDGCDDPVVLGRVRLPIFFLLFTVVDIVGLTMVARATIRGHWSNHDVFQH